MAATLHQSRWAMVLSSFGLMADIYDLTIINLVRPSLEADFGKLTPEVDGVLTAAALVGAIVGQVTFGALADWLGRRFIFISTASIICVASLGSALAQDGSFGLSIYTILSIWRFFIGLGIGGEYPLAAANTMENVDPASSGRALALTFSGMAAGQLLAPSVVILLTTVLGFDAVHVWRPAFAFGAALAAVCAVLRCAVLQETSSFQRAAEAQQGGGGQIGAGSRVQALLNMKRSLAGTAGTWFLYDVATYGVGMFSTTIFETKPGLESAKVTLIIAIVCLPGIFAAVAITNYVRMFDLQLAGLGLMTVGFSVLTVLHPDIGGWHYVMALTVFSLMRSFDTMGPGVTTFSVPGQIFPTAIRGTAHGLSAAMGKLGAVVGTVAFPVVSHLYGIPAVMRLMAIVCALTIAFTWQFTPSYGAEELTQISQLDPAMSAEMQALLAERLLFGEKEALIEKGA